MSNNGIHIPIDGFNNISENAINNDMIQQKTMHTIDWLLSLYFNNMLYINLIIILSIIFVFIFRYLSYVRKINKQSIEQSKKITKKINSIIGDVK